MAHRYFEGKAHAMLYQKYRPIPPKILVERVISFLKQKYSGKLDTSFDVGCGSGQSTSFFAPHFSKVIGTDISPAMVEKANENNTVTNVSYLVGPSEEIPAEDGSVQLVTASQAAHWFDMPKFYKECRRVLSPGGVLALYGYELPKFHFSNDESINRDLDKALNDFYLGDLVGCWTPERKIVDNRYTDFVIPFEDFTRDESFFHDMNSNVSDFMMYVHTWSGYQAYCKKNGGENGRQLVQQFEDRIMAILKVPTSPEDTTFTKRTNFFLLMARNGASN